MRSFARSLGAFAAVLSTALAQNNFISPPPPGTGASPETWPMNIDQELHWTSTYPTISMLLWSNYQDPKTKLYQTYTIIDNLTNPQFWRFQVGTNIDISHSNSYHFEIYNGTADDFAKESFFISSDFNVVSPSASTQGSTATPTGSPTGSTKTSSTATTSSAQSTITQVVVITPTAGAVTSVTSVVGGGSEVSRATSSTGSSSPTAAPSSGGLSHDATVGIGVGVGVGVPLIAAAIAAIWFFTRKRGAGGKAGESSAYGINYDEAAR